jgi:hypothetical protein
MGRTYTAVVVIKIYLEGTGKYAYHARRLEVYKQS